MIKNILFLGQKPIGEKCFEILLKAQDRHFCIKGVVSNKTTNVWWKTNQIFRTATIRHTPFISNHKRHDYSIQRLIKKECINVIISVQHPWILPEETLSLVSGFAFNLHNAKLPEYRGYNTYNHAILNGEKFYTCTIHWITEEVDGGDIALEKTFLIAAEETAASLYEKAVKGGFEIFKRLISLLKNDLKVPRKRIVGRGTFYPRSSIGKFREIKNTRNFNELEKKSRAFYFPPYEPAYFLLRGRKFYILPRFYSW